MSTDGQPVGQEISELLSKAANLDPNIQNAVREGVSVVIEALRGGAVANEQVISAIVASGQATSLPPGALRDMAMKAVHPATDSVIDRRAPAAAEVVSAVALNNAYVAHQQAVQAEPTTRPVSEVTRADFAKMDEAERLGYFRQLANLSLHDWRDMSDQQRQTSVSNTVDEANQKLDLQRERLNEMTLDMLTDPKLGATDAEREAARRRIDDKVNAWMDKPANQGRTVKDFVDDMQCSKTGLTQYEEMLAAQRLGLRQGHLTNREALDQALAAQDSLSRDKVDQAHGQTTTAAAKLHSATTEQNNMREEIRHRYGDEPDHVERSGAPSASAREAVYEASTQALQQGVSEASSVAQVKEIRSAGADNLTSGSALDAAAAKAEVEDEFSAAAAAPVSVAEAAPPSRQHTIKADQLAPALAAFVAPAVEPEQKPQIPAPVVVATVRPTAQPGMSG